MDVAQLVLEYLKSLIWPIQILLAVIIFRKELRELLKSLQHLRLPGGTELDWQRNLEQAEAAAKEVESSSLGSSEKELQNVQPLSEKVQQLGVVGLQFCQ